jgi:hypothetical protein
MEMIMQKAALVLAGDGKLGTDEIEAVIAYLSNKIADAAAREEPAPFLAYRNRLIFNRTLEMRRRCS